jgi:cytochrome c biogenesis protein CcmG, thiol:disulfide interchange protein DsbE
MRFLSKPYFLLLTVLILNLSFSSSAYAVSPDYQGTDWILKNLQGKQVQLSNYQKNPVLLVFWATWCPYCKKLLPGIAELNDKYESMGLKIIAVNIREDWKPEVYWRNYGYKFDTVLNGDEIANIYGVRGTPGIVFIAPGGKVLNVKSFSDPHHPLLEKFAAMYTQDK